MKRCLLQILLLFFLSSHAFALGTGDLVTDTTATKILNKKCIRLGTSEVLPIQFETACRALSQSRLVQSMQEEFCRSISENGKVDFPIFETTPGNYYYINEKKQRTNITELYKKKTDDHSYDYIVRASGKRFFGKYDIIVHLQIVDASSAGIVYSVSTHAYPHSWLTRSSHKVGLTRSFFKKKMKLISWVAREIATGLCEQMELKDALNPRSK